MLDTINRVLEDFWSSPLIQLLLLLAVLWILFNYFALIRGNPEDRSFQRSKTWLQQDTFATLYRQLLGDFFLKPLAHWVGDQAHFSATNTSSTSNAPRWMQRWFGFNPFTIASYEKALMLAFFYPIISLFLTWWWTGSGYIGDHNYLHSEGIDSTLRSWILLGFFLLTLSLIIIFKRLQGGGQIAALAVVVLITTGIIAIYNGDILDYLTALSIVFLIIFISIYCSGGLLAWLLWKNRTKAHQLIYPFAFAFSGAFAVVFVNTFAFVFAFIVAITTGMDITSMDTRSMDTIITVTSEGTNVFVFASAFAVAAFTIAGVFAIEGAFAVVVAVTVAGLFTGLFADTFADTFVDMFVGTFVGTFKVAFSVAFSVAFAVAVAGVIFILANFYYKKAQTQQALLHFWWIYIGLIILVSVVLINYDVNAENLSFLLIFTLSIPSPNSCEFRFKLSRC